MEKIEQFSLWFSRILESDASESSRSCSGRRISSVRICTPNYVNAQGSATNLIAVRLRLTVPSLKFAEIGAGSLSRIESAVATQRKGRAFLF